MQCSASWIFAQKNPREASGGRSRRNARAAGRQTGAHRVSGEKRRWLGPESNRRHEDFQSSALPTELPSLSRRSPRFCMELGIDRLAIGYCARGQVGIRPRRMCQADGESVVSFLKLKVRRQTFDVEPAAGTTRWRGSVLAAMNPLRGLNF